MTESSREAGASITQKPDGPLIVKSLRVLQNSKGEALGTGATIALCRCGQSGRKPYCDGAHWGAGFVDEDH